nr:CONSTANS-like 1 protein [Ipomoea batatas]
MSGAQGAQPKESRTATTYESVPQEENKTRLDIRSREDERGIQVDKIQDKVKDAAGKGGPVFGAGKEDHKDDLASPAPAKQNYVIYLTILSFHSHHYSVPEKNMSYGGIASSQQNPPPVLSHPQPNPPWKLSAQGMEYETSTLDTVPSIQSQRKFLFPPWMLELYRSQLQANVSISHSRPPKGTIDLFSGPPVAMPSQLAPMDREARVLRYREKKKTRKFEKTIRYARERRTRKPGRGLKGRFAKRTDAEGEVDQIFLHPI